MASDTPLNPDATRHSSGQAPNLAGARNAGGAAGRRPDRRLDAGARAHALRAAARCGGRLHVGPRMGDRHLQASGAAELGAGGEPPRDRRRGLAGLSRLAALRRRHLRLRLPARPRPDGPAARRRRHAAADRHRLLCVADAGVQSQRRGDAVLGWPALGAVARGRAARARLVGAGRRACRRRSLRQADDGAAACHAGGLDAAGTSAPGNAWPLPAPGSAWRYLPRSLRRWPFGSSPTISPRSSTLRRARPRRAKAAEAFPSSCSTSS